MTLAIRKGWRAAVAAAVGLCVLWLAARTVAWSDVAAALARADIMLIALAAGLVVAALLLRAVCWHELLAATGAPTSFVRTWGAMVVGQCLNKGMPARVGDAARVALMGTPQLPKVTVATSLVVEKLFDIVALLILLVVVSWSFELPQYVHDARHGVVVLAAIPLLVAALMAVCGEPLLQWVSAPSRGAVPGWRSRLGRHGVSVLRGLSILRRRPTLAVLQVGYLVGWLCLAGVNFVVLEALGIAAPLAAALLLLVILQVGTSVPSTPGKVGVFQYLCVVTLAPFGVPQDEALAYGIVLHVVEYGTVMGLGALCLLSGLGGWRCPPTTMVKAITDTE